VSWKYRYHLEFIPDDDLLERCNALGDAGWSMVGPPLWSPPDLERECLGVWRCFFKQTISHREQALEVFQLGPREGRP
jgi:hypothetical protein